MEFIISRLLVPDSAIIQQATQELKSALKTPSAVGDLCSVIKTSNNPQVRQYAAIILRLRLKKSKNWNHLDNVSKDRITNDIFETLQTENEQLVLKAIARLIASIAKHDLPRNHCRQLLEFLGKLCTSSSTGTAAENVRGFFIMAVLAEECPDIFSSVLPNIGAVVVETLKTVPDARSTLLTYSLTTMKNLAQHFCDDQSIQSCYAMMLPQILKLLKQWAEIDSQVTCDLLEMLDDLVEFQVVNTMQQVHPLVCICLQLSSNTNEQIQFKSLCVIDTVIKNKRKAIMKSDLLLPILEVLVNMMQSPVDEDLEYDDANELNSVVIYASQVLDGIAFNLPPSKIMPFIMETVKTFATSPHSNPYRKKAAFVIMAVTSEGCAEYICNKCFNQYFELMCKGLEEDVLSIKNAALYALGQFAEHFQPEMSKHSEQLMPILYKFLEHIITNLQTVEKSHLDRVFYALETYIEHLEKDTFIPYLSPLLRNLLPLVTAESKPYIKQMALSAIGACASTAEDSISPFLHQIVDCLAWLMAPVTQDLLDLQIQAIETMATLARSVLPEHFQQFAHDCIKCGYVILESQCDPDLEGSIYGLFGAASGVLKKDMSEDMGPLIANMLKTLENNEEIVIDFDEEGIPGCADLSDSGEEIDLDALSDDEDDEEVTGFNVDNAYVDKKAAACYAIKDFALNTGSSFTPYLATCSNAISKLLEYPHGTIKKAALDALSQLCVNCISLSTMSEASASLGGVSGFIQKCSEIIHADEDKEVVAQALEAYAHILKSSKNLVLERREHREAIFNCILDVFQKRTLCQLEEDDVAEDDESAEHEELLIEYAGDVLPQFGRAISADEFKDYFFTIFPCLQSKLKLTCTLAQRAFGIGILAECMEPLAPVLHEFSNEILPEFIAGVQDEYDDVRNNAVYGLGEMMYHGKEKFFVHYGEILQVLSQCLAQEKVPKVIDNVCAAVARMIITNTALVPLEQVFPVLVTCVPLKKDFKENSIMMKCFLHLYEGGHDVVTQHLDKIMLTTIHIIHHKEGEEDALALAEHIFVITKRDFPHRISGLRITDDLLPTYTSLINK